MFCQHCNKETEEGRFCTNCGKELATDESAATKNPNIEETTESTEGSSQVQSNEFVDQMKEAGSDFGQFFMALIKKPSEARNVNANQLVSSVIMMAIFSLVISISYYYALKSNALGFFMEISFFNHLVVPFAIFFILFIIIASITFIGIKISGRNISYRAILTKYGAYLIPFSLVFVLGILLSLIGILTLTMLAFMISILGILLVIPTLIIMDYSAIGFDRIYLLLGIYFVSLLIFAFFMQSFLESLIGGLLGNLTSFF